MKIVAFSYNHGALWYFHMHRLKHQFKDWPLSILDCKAISKLKPNHLLISIFQTVSKQVPPYKLIWIIEEVHKYGPLPISRHTVKNNIYSKVATRLLAWFSLNVPFKPATSGILTSEGSKYHNWLALYKKKTHFPFFLCERKTSLYSRFNSINDFIHHCHLSIFTLGSCLVKEIFCACLGHSQKSVLKCCLPVYAPIEKYTGVTCRALIINPYSVSVTRLASEAVLNIFID